MVEKVYQHQPVLAAEVIEHLAVKPEGVYVDATFGRGGHAQLILGQLGPTGRLLAMDKDQQAVDYACQLFLNDKRFAIRQGSFTEMANFLRDENLYGNVDGILLDLGVSSPQLDDPERGFSFLRAGKLDMRMDTSSGVDAATWLAAVSEEELSRVFWEYGEERYSRRIARAIVKARTETPITTTDQLAGIVATAHPAWERGKNPATRCFQAIRIAINHELDDLQKVLTQSVDVLKVGGRLVVISFHSLEDRVVKHFIQKEERGEELPAGLPVKSTDFSAKLKKLGRAVKPTDKEVASNPRARSAVLRIAEKLS